MGWGRQGRPLGRRSSEVSVPGSSGSQHLAALNSLNRGENSLPSERKTFKVAFSFYRKRTLENGLRLCLSNLALWPEGGNQAAGGRQGVGITRPPTPHLPAQAKLQDCAAK